MSALDLILAGMENGRSPDPSVSVQEAFVRRLKSLARTAPLHELEAGKAMRSGDWAAYDLRGLCLAAIDTAIEHMGIEYGARPEEILFVLAAVAAHSAPDRPAAEYRRVAAAVLEGLLNEKDRRQAFSISYSDPTDAFRRHTLAFHLLREIEAPDGTVVVRATTEAINLFVGALDLDVEDAQAAAEAVLRSQLARGRLDQAVTTAREARIRSIQFAEKIRSVLDATRRDIRQVDWGLEVPQLLDDALGHLKERIDVERQLIRTTRSSLDQADPTKIGQAADLVALLEDCRRRHTQLHGRLIESRGIFLDEQERQIFAPAQVLPVPDPEADLLRPLLAAGRGEALPALAAFFTAAAGPRPPTASNLASLVSSLLQPRRERAPEGVELVEPDLQQDMASAQRFSAEVRLAVAETLDGMSGERRLSELLDHVRPLGHKVSRLLTLVVAGLFAPDAGGGGDQDFTGREVQSFDDGAPLTDPNFGGADLLVRPGVTWEVPMPGEAAGELTNA